MRFAHAVFTFAALSISAHSNAQTLQPSTFSIDGNAARCGNIPIILDPSIPDVGQSGYGLIFLNPNYLEGLKAGLRLWWLAHECAHHVVGPDETAADCWSIRKVRDEGWFPPEMFYWMAHMFAGNRGDSEHPPGPQRVRDMQHCYNS